MYGASSFAVGARAPLWVLAVAALCVSGLRAQSVTYNGSASFSHGSYIFTEPTSSYWLSNGLSLRWGAASLSAGLPVVVQNSGVVSFVAGRPLPTGGENAGAVRRRMGGEPVGTRRGPGGGMPSGMLSVMHQTGEDSTTVVHRDSYEAQIGDPLLSGSLELHSGPGTLRSVALDLAAKAPLRSVDSGVGTGAWDVGAGASVVVGSGSSLFFANVSYWSYGDLPDLELGSGLLYGVSASRSISAGRMAVSATLSGASAMVETMDAPISAGLGITFLPRIGRAISAGMSFGLSEASPAISAYLGWSLRLGG